MVSDTLKLMKAEHNSSHQALQHRIVSRIAGLAFFSVCALSFPATAQAGFSLKKLTGKISRGIGKHIFGPGIDAATAPTIANAEGVGMRLIREMDKTLENNIKLANRELAETLSNSLIQVDEILSKHEGQIDQLFTKHEGQIDQILRDKIASFDHLLEARIEQIDDLLERQIGNVDVVATKAVSALETGAERAIAQAENGTSRVIRRAYSYVILITFLISSAVIIIILFLSSPGTATASAKPRNSKIGAISLLAVAALALFAYVLGPGVDAPPSPDDPPPTSASLNAADTFIAEHEEGFRRSMNALDLTQARVHAYRLAFMDPNKYRDELVKTELIRDILARPTSLSDISSKFSIMNRFSRLDAHKSDLVDDRNMMVVAAYILWRLGDTRGHEHLAAQLCAKSLDGDSPSAFPLRTLAYNYLHNYVKHPLGFVDLQGLDGFTISDGGESTYLDFLLRGAPTTQKEFEDIFNAAPPPKPEDEFAETLWYNTHRIDLHESLTDSYFRMLDDLYPAMGNNDSADTRLRRCAENANIALSAWESFQEDLMAHKPTLRLAALDVNIAILSRIDQVYIKGSSACKPPAAGVASNELREARVQEIVILLRDVIPAFSLNLRVKKELTDSHKHQDVHLARIEQWFEERAKLNTTDIDQKSFEKLKLAIESALELGLYESVRETFSDKDITTNRMSEIEKMSEGHNLNREHIHLI